MKWEYVTGFLGDPAFSEVDDRLDMWGEGSWELVSVVDGWGYFKRPVKELLPLICTGSIPDDATITYIGGDNLEEECCE